MIEGPPATALVSKQVVKKGDIKPGVVADEKNVLVSGDAIVEIN